MVDKELLKKYKALVHNENKANSEEEQEYISQCSEDDCENVLLFFSFDIVNSSLFKNSNYYGWSMVIDHILSSIRNYVKSKIKSAELWRILGDEVIFIVKISDIDVLFEYIEIIYDILTSFCTRIENGTLINSEDDTTDLVKIQDALSLQATAWIANVADKKALKNNRKLIKCIDNVFEEIVEKPDYKFYEFIGVDIDTGFRLSKETRAGRLVLNFELAYLMALKKDGAYAKRLNILTYKKLKGVWNNMSYPIIWYYDNTKHNGLKFHESFPFDAIEQDDLYVEYFSKKKFDESMYKDVKSALQKICRDRKLQRKIDRIEDIIKKEVSMNKPYINTSKLELHCVAVCFNDKGEIFVVKRAIRANNEYYPLKWEFGCAKANYSEHIYDTVKREYKDDFNIDIELFTDKNREDSQPLPIAVYTMNKKSELHKGIIFIANMHYDEIKLDSEKHEEYRFIREEDLSSLDKDEYVPDALDTMEKAFRLYREKHSK